MKGVVIFIPGFPGWGRMDNYWETALDPSIIPDNIVAKPVFPSPVGSHHDRACEIFAQITGTLVNYGYEHSNIFNHSQFGRDYSGQPPMVADWGSSNPIHLVCHSTAINTARVLQKLLENDFWNCKTSSKWILSISCLNGCFGPSVLFDLLENELISLISKRKLCYLCNPVQKTTNCIHRKIRKAVKILIKTMIWAGTKKLKLTSDQMRMALDWPLEHWDISSENHAKINSKTLTDGEFFEYFRNLKNSPIFQTTDNIIFEYSPPGFSRLNSFINDIENGNLKDQVDQKFLYPNTFYICLFSSATDSSNLFVPSEMSPILWPFSLAIMDKPNKPVHNNYTDKVLEELKLASDVNNPLKDNDGLVSVYDQCVPRYAEPYIQSLPKVDKFENAIKPGIWYIKSIQELLQEITNKDAKISVHFNRLQTWDHFDACWARTFLKYEKDELPKELQQKLYLQLYLFVSNIERIFRDQDKI